MLEPSGRPLDGPYDLPKGTLLHHAQTLPSVHSLPKQAPSRSSSLPQHRPPHPAASSPIMADLSPLSTRASPLSSRHISTLSTDIPNSSDPPPPYTPSVDTPPDNQPLTEQGYPQEKPPAEWEDASAFNPPRRTTTSRRYVLADESVTLPANLAKAAKAAAIASAQRKASASSLRSLEGSIATAARARRKGSSSSLGPLGSGGDIYIDIDALRNDVNELRGKIIEPKRSNNFESTAGHGTPPNAAESGTLDESKKGDSLDNAFHELRDGTGDIERAVQQAADYAAKDTKKEAEAGTSALAEALEDYTSSSEETTPRASDIEDVRTSPD